MKSARLLSKGLLCLYDNYLYRCAHSWAIELNTRREIPYLRAPMYYSLYLCHLLPIARDVPFNDQFRSVRHSTKTWSQSKSRRQLIKSHINWLPNREKKKKNRKKTEKRILKRSRKSWTLLKQKYSYSFLNQTTFHIYDFIYSQ